MQSEDQDESATPPDGDLAKAFALLTANGYAIRRRAGQAMIQIVRQRGNGDFAWKYHVNKYERRLYSPKGTEIECVTLLVDKILWQKCELDPRTEAGDSEAMG